MFERALELGRELGMQTIDWTQVSRHARTPWTEEFVARHADDLVVYELLGNEHFPLARHLHRFAARMTGVLHEVMVVVQKKRHLLAAADTQAIVAKVDPKHQKTWKDLVTAALDTSGNTATLLLRIRNNAAFHYGPKDLGDGYKKQFVTDARRRRTSRTRPPNTLTGRTWTAPASTTPMRPRSSG